MATEKYVLSDKAIEDKRIFSNNYYIENIIDTKKDTIKKIEKYLKKIIDNFNYKLDIIYEIIRYNININYTYLYNRIMEKIYFAQYSHAIKFKNNILHKI